MGSNVVFILADLGAMFLLAVAISINALSKTTTPRSRKLGYAAGFGALALLVVGFFNTVINAIDHWQV